MGGIQPALRVALLTCVCSVGNAANVHCQRLLEGLNEQYSAREVLAEVFAPTAGETVAVAEARAELEKRAKPFARSNAAREDLFLRTFLEAAAAPKWWLATYEATPDPTTRRKRTPTERAYARAMVAYLEARFPPPEPAHYRRPFPAKPSDAELALQKSLTGVFRTPDDAGNVARAERAARYLGKKHFTDDAAFDAWVESKAYRDFANEVSALSPDELPWIDRAALKGQTALDLRTPLTDRGANHQGITAATLAGHSVVLKKGPLGTLAHEMRAYLLLNKLGLGPTAFGLVAMEPGTYALCLEVLPAGVDSKALLAKTRHGVDVVTREVQAAGLPLNEQLVQKVRQAVLRMEAGGIGTAEDLQFRLGRDGSTVPFDLEGVVRGSVVAYGVRLPSPVESAEPLMRVLEALASQERPPQRVFSKSR